MIDIDATRESYRAIKRTAKSGDEVDATGNGKRVMVTLANHPEIARRTVVLMKRRNRRAAKQALRAAW